MSAAAPPAPGDGGRPSDSPGSQPSAVYPGTIVDLRALRAPLRRRRRLWISTGVLGLLIGLCIGLVSAPGYSATASVLILQEGLGAQTIATDVAAIQSDAVARQVLLDLHAHSTPEQLLSRYTAVFLSDNVLQLTLMAPTAATAMSESNTVIAAYLRFRAQQLNDRIKVVQQVLGAQITELSNQVDSLSKAVDASSSGGDSSSGGSSQSLSGLEAERSQAVLQQWQLQQSMQSQVASLQTDIESSGALGEAVLIHRSHLKPLLTDALSGLVGGLVFGMGFVVVAELASDNLRRRRDIAQALAVPVELSLPAFPRPSWIPLALLRGRLARPGRYATEMSRFLEAKLPASGSHGLAVISVGSDKAVALALAHLSASLARHDRRVAITDLTSSKLLARLLSSSGEGPSSNGAHGEPAPVGVLAPGTEGSVDAAASQAGGTYPPRGTPVVPCVLVVATLDPKRGADEASGLADRAVVVVRAGAATADALRAQGEMIRAARMVLDSAVLVGADEHDYTPPRGQASQLHTPERALVTEAESVPVTSAS